jgi:hypothetical protein
MVTREERPAESPGSTRLLRLVWIAGESSGEEGVERRVRQGLCARQQVGRFAVQAAVGVGDGPVRGSTSVRMGY